MSLTPGLLPHSHWSRPGKESNVLIGPRQQPGWGGFCPSPPPQPAAQAHPTPSSPLHLTFGNATPSFMWLKRWAPLTVLTVGFSVLLLSLMLSFPTNNEKCKCCIHTRWEPVAFRCCPGLCLLPQGGLWPHLRRCVPVTVSVKLAWSNKCPWAVERVSPHWHLARPTQSVKWVCFAL